MFRAASADAPSSTRGLDPIRPQDGAPPRIARPWRELGWLPFLPSWPACPRIAPTPNCSRSSPISRGAFPPPSSASAQSSSQCTRLSWPSAREPRGHELDKFRERLAVIEAEFRSALSIVNNLQWRAQMTAGPTSHYLAAEARAADLLVANSESDDRKVSASPEIEVNDLVDARRPPVLLAPPGVMGLKLTRTLVCWKDFARGRGGRSLTRCRF